MQPRNNSSGNRAVQNVGDAERQVSLAAGALLAGLGLSRGGLSGLMLLGIGGALAYRGAAGYCSMYQAMETEHGQCLVSLR